MTGWAPPKQNDDDWRDRFVFRLDSWAEVRAARNRWEKLRSLIRSALDEQASALICYQTRDGLVHVWINDELGQPLDLNELPDLQWLLDETLDLLGWGAWKL